MKTKTLFRTALALTATLATIALASCSAGTSSGTSTAHGTTTVKMAMNSGPEADAMQKVATTYNAGQGKKDGTRVQLVVVHDVDLFTKEATEMRAKSTSIDVYFTTTYLIDQHKAYLTPLTGIDTANYYPNLVKSLSFNGKLYALPTDVSTYVLLYRKDLIDQLLSSASAKQTYASVAQSVLGHTMTPKPPAEWTWDDFIAMAAYFTKSVNPAAPTTYGSIMQTQNNPENIPYWDTLLWSFGGNWVNAGKAAMDSPAGHKAMDVLQTLANKKLIAPNSVNANYAQVQAAMSSGQTAFAMQWNAGFSQLNDPKQSPTTGGHMGIAPVPAGTQRKVHVQALAVGLNKYSQHQDAAMNWLKYLSTPAAMNQYAKSGGAPAMPAVLKENAAVDGAFTPMSQYIKLYGFTEPVPPNGAKYQLFTSLAQILSPAWAATSSGNQALQQADTAITQAWQK